MRFPFAHRINPHPEASILILAEFVVKGRDGGLTQYL